MQRHTRRRWDYVSENWKSLRGAVRRRWSKLKHEDMELIQGKRDVLIASVQKRYAITAEEVHQQIEEWLEIVGG